MNDVRDVSPDVLAAARVLALFTIGETPWSTRAEGGDLLLVARRDARPSRASTRPPTPATPGPSTAPCSGARFDGHPWTQQFAIDVVDEDHPATAHIGQQWDWRDEVYLFKDLRPDARVLLRLAEGQVDLSAPGGRVPDCGFPLAWCVEDGAARSFYTALGHFPLAWELPVFLRHLGGGLAWLESNA